MKLGTEVLLIGLALQASMPLRAQNPDRPDTTETASLMLHLRAHGSVGNALQILRQVDSSRSRRDLDALADSLTAFALEQEGRYESSAGVRWAVLAIAQSGAAEGEGIPYAGAGDRLMRIAQESKALVGGSLMSVAQLADREEAVLKLRKLAITDGRLAAPAVDMLDRYGPPEGVAVLLEMYRSQSVSSPSARSVLDRIALKRGWRTDSPSRRP